MGGYHETMIHRDFYDAQVLWDSARAWIVDFDQLSVGDPALDLGHFVRAFGKFRLPRHGPARFIGHTSSNPDRDIPSVEPDFD